MNEIKKTLAILKARWPEVVFIVGIYLLAILSRKFILKVEAKSALTLYYTIIFVPLLFSLTSILLRFGFLRTVCSEEQKRQTLVVLLRTGIHFFWRMFVLGLIYALPFILSIIIFSKLMSLRVIPWFRTLYSILVNLILIKLVVLIPALIIVLDCRVFDSFKFLKLYKLSNIKELIFLYYGNIAIGFFGPVLSRYYLGTSYGTTCCNVTTTPQYILTTAFSIISYFISLMIAVMAVRFVASQNLVSDNHEHSNDLNFEDLQKYTNRS